MLLQMALFHSFLWLSNIPLYYWVGEGGEPWARLHGWELGSFPSGNALLHRPNPLPGRPVPQVKVKVKAHLSHPFLDATLCPHKHPPRELIRNSSLCFWAFPRMKAPAGLGQLICKHKGWEVLHICCGSVSRIPASAFPTRLQLHQRKHKSLSTFAPLIFSEVLVSTC